MRSKLALHVEQDHMDEMKKYILGVFYLEAPIKFERGFYKMTLRPVIFHNKNIGIWRSKLRKEKKKVSR